MNGKECCNDSFTSVQQMQTGYLECPMLHNRDKNYLQYSYVEIICIQNHINCLLLLLRSKEAAACVCRYGSRVESFSLAGIQLRLKRLPWIQSAQSWLRSGHVTWREGIWPMSWNVPMATVGNRLYDTKQQSIMGLHWLHYTTVLASLVANLWWIVCTLHFITLQCCWILNSCQVR